MLPCVCLYVGTVKALPPCCLPLAQSEVCCKAAVLSSWARQRHRKIRVEKWFPRCYSDCACLRLHDLLLITIKFQVENTWGFIFSLRLRQSNLSETTEQIKPRAELDFRSFCMWLCACPAGCHMHHIYHTLYRIYHIYHTMYTTTTALYCWQLLNMADVWISVISLSVRGIWIPGLKCWEEEDAVLLLEKFCNLWQRGKVKRSGQMSTNY